MAIGRRAIVEYSRCVGVPPDIFKRLIRAMDEVYLGHKNGSGKTFTKEMLKR